MPKEPAQPLPAAKLQAPLGVVAIGASAGGLEACQKLLDATPAGHGLAFIIVQHLDPTHPSLMVDLLVPHTGMSVEAARDGAQLKAGHVHVLPPGTYLTLRGDRIQLSPPDNRHGARLPFDALLHSLANAFGPRAQAIILSGTGADGTLGLVSIKKQGGYVMAQEPTEAGFAGMPESAIATSLVDRVLPVAALGAAAIAHAEAPQDSEPAPAEAPDSVARIIALLRAETAHDFTLYKGGTLERRIRRRMALAGSPDLAAYLERLKGDADERASLADDILINVTAFFRDPKVFARLEDDIIPEMARAHPAEEPIRLWSAGCSTGEEAYSLAILFLDAMVKSGRSLKLQVFASDADPEAVAFAREGLYPEAALAEIPPERLKRHFLKEPLGYRVVPALRACVVFTVQDVLTDPPFSRLDLVACRNLLIYLGATAQETVIGLLHFALKPGGLLLLGTAEAPGPLQGRFEVVSKAERLYRRVGPVQARGAGPFRPTSELFRPQSRAPIAAAPRRSFAEICRAGVVEAYAPAAVLINGARQCLYSVGPIARFLNLAPGYPTHDLLDLVSPVLKARLLQALAAFPPDKAHQRLEGGTDSLGKDFDVEIRRIEGEDEPLVLLAFLEVPMVPAATAPASPAQDSARVATLERQLAQSRGELADTLRALERASEEQKAIQEEALSINEEFQSTNEELLTSKEELQSLNEELTALNSQLQEALERQRSTANDLQNILHSTDVATLFLDLDLNIRYFTPATRALFHVIPGDIGRPLTDLASLAVDPALPADARQVLVSLKPVECEIQTRNASWYIRRILPYRAENDAVEGVVITFTNISDRKGIARALEQAKAQAESANVAKSRFLAAASHDLRQPLQSLALLHDLLVRAVENERARQLVGRLGQTLFTINSMMNALLDINQIEAGVVIPRLVDFPVQEVLSRMREEFAHNALVQQLELRVVNSSRVIRSDPSLLEQMMRNLMSNALKYTRSGKVLLGCRMHGGALSIEIWDTGIGMPEGQLKAIFKEYHQIDNPARERSRGLGLGLAIVQRLADLLGHTIDVRSRLDHGSVFAVEVALNADKAVSPAPATAVVCTRPVRPAKVLVVEDDPTICDLLMLHLSGEGHQVDTAVDGASALARVAQGFRPDLLLTDFNLPNAMDGLALASKLRERLDAALPVIILTGDISSQTLRSIADAGAVQLNKPVAARELGAAMRRLLGETPPPAEEAPPAREPPAGKDMVFVIDDDADIREQLCEVITQSGMPARGFESAEAFLRAGLAPIGACLLLDAYLPGMGGLDLLRRLRREGAQLPVIMITGNSDVGMAVEAMKAGAADFIEKPVGAEALLASIRASLAAGHETDREAQAHEVAKALLAQLTPRQREIMALVLAGHPSKNIAADLGISQRTVESHRATIMLKTKSRSLPALARLAYEASGVS